MKKKIYIEATPIVPERRSGIGHATLEILRELDKEIYGAQYDVYAFVPWNEAAAIACHGFQNIKVKKLPFTHKVFSLLTRMKFGIPIDIFLGKGVYIFPNYRNTTLLFSKSITFVHDVCYLTHPEYVQPKNLEYLQRYMNLWVRRTDHLVTISNSSRTEIITGLTVEEMKVSVVRLGVDPDHFYPRSSVEINQLRQKYNLGSNYFLYVGNIEPRKNISLLIKAFSRSGKLKSHTLFLVGGDGWLNDSINEEIVDAQRKAIKIIRNDTYVSDEELPGLMSGASAVILPSHHEGFGLSVAQAQACGTPVIVSDIPVLHETTYGNAIFFDNGSESSLETALGVGANQSHTKPRHTFTWKDTLGQLTKLFDAE